MNTKQILSSVLCLSVILVFAGCDWCGCCKVKEEITAKAAPAAEAKAPEVAKTVEPKAIEAKAPEVAPKMPMPIEPHPMPMPEEHPMPHPMPIEPKMPHPMPIEPKMPMEPKIPMPKA